MTNEDKVWIERAIKHYDKKFPFGPDSIAASVVSSQHEQQELRVAGNVDKYGIIHDSDSARRVGVSMPSNFLAVLRKQYPDIISDKEKYTWFKRNFPMFVVYK